MKRMMKRMQWLVLLPCIALAAVADDYATQWPLATPGEGGAYRVALEPAVYMAARQPDLRDIDVVDADGVPVPAQLFRPEAPSNGSVRRVPVRWFALPQAGMAQAGGIAMAIERNTDGSVLRVETRSADGGATVPAATAWLVDASAIDGSVAALLLDWATEAGDVDLAYRVDGSDDLRDWRVLQARVSLVDLSRAGERLQQRRVPVEASVRYLRLTPLQGSGRLRILGMQAELPAEPARALPAQWRELSSLTVAEGGGTAHEYTLDGRFPVESADLALEGNSTGEWTLYSRDDPASPWRLRAGPWVAFRIGAQGGAERSEPQPLAGRIRDRHWKLAGRTPGQAAPVLRLGWRPESLVFIAQGAAPYRLVAGSARAARADAPVARSLEAIRRQRGEDWQPSPASLGAAAPLAGDAALRPAHDWKSWLLWVVLALGAAVVAGFAFSLLRRPKPQP